jgi:asparagine synthase (glutamine-hydrolysing)
MRSDAPFGAFLSGGVDSSAVVAAMARHSSQPVRTFTVGFQEQEFSEIEYARLVARRFGTRHQEVIVTAHDFFELWPEAVRMRGAPVSEASDIPILMLAREAAKSVKVVLTGEGSDEILAGYSKYKAELYTKAYQNLIPTEVHDGLIAPLVDMLPYSMRRVKVLSKALSQRNIMDRVRIWFGGLSVEERNALFSREQGHLFSDPFPFAIDNVSNLRRAQFFDQTSYLPDNSLERGDRMLMAGSIEGRMPFMDVELAKLAARLPDNFLLRRGIGKAILRDAHRDILPARLLNRSKIGFRVPFHIWFRTSHAHVLRDLLTSQGARIRILLNGAMIDRYVSDHIEGRSNHERILWSLCNLEQFLRVFEFPPEELREAVQK